MNAKVLNPLMYVSVAASIFGVLFFKQTTILAEAAVVIMALLVPLMIVAVGTKIEQIKKICIVLGIVEAVLVFATIVGNKTW
jgi:hypothetical protein